MMRSAMLAFVAVLMVGCAPNAHVTVPPVLVSPSQLDANIGTVVTIRGLVERTKIATILGVDVASHGPDLRGSVAEATGTLTRYTIPPSGQRDAFTPLGIAAERGPGTYYLLTDSDTNSISHVRQIVE